MRVILNFATVYSRKQPELENKPSSKISRDFWEKSKNDCSKTAEISKISRKSQKEILK